jgi:diguanylate cyclase (GGDEF)-like protein/PAS domain S-box-containing protein
LPADVSGRPGGAAASPATIGADGASEAQLRLLVDRTSDYAIFVLSPDGIVMTWNIGAKRIKGYDASEIIGQHFSIFYEPEDVARGHPEYELRTAMLDGHYSEEGWRVRKDGGRFWASVTITALRSEEGELQGFGKVTRDLTEPRAAEQALAQLQADQERTLEALAEGVMMYSFTGTGLDLRWANRTACDLLGVEVDVLRQRLRGELPIPDLCDTVGAPIDRDILPHFVTRRTGRAVDGYVWGFTNPEGRRRWLNSSSRPIRDTDGEITGVVLSILDITERHDARLELVRVSERFAALVEHSSDVICILDPTGIVKYASPAYMTVYGEDPTNRVGRLLQQRIHPDDRGSVEDAMDLLVDTAEEVLTIECRIVQPDGTIRHLEMTASNHLGDRAVNGIVTNSRDVTDRVETATRLAHEAMHDALTGLANRALLVDRLTQALGRAKRTSTQCALLFVDLDRFKNVNDSLGHSCGDQLLITVAERLARVMRPGDTLARLGGDEFVILAEQVEDVSVAQTIADRIQDAVSKPVSLEGRMITAGCSIGITLSYGGRPEELLQEADTALYRAKARGRGRWELYDQAMRVGAQRRMDMEAQLRHAIDHGRVVVHYQPIVSLDTGVVTGAEALVRLTDTKDRLVFPDEFIPAAEDSGLVVPLGLEVLRQAGRQQVEWSAAGSGTPDYVSVNVSARQLQSPSFVLDLRRVLEEIGLPGESLCLELTETALIEADQSTRGTVQAVIDLGITIALDDFGTGWSSLAHLRRFPIQVLKIDRTFTAGLGRNASDTEVVKAIIGLAGALELDVVAEGIERAEQAEELRRLGCPYGQGYFYGRPLPASQLSSDALSG